MRRHYHFNHTNGDNRYDLKKTESYSQCEIHFFSFDAQSRFKNVYRLVTLYQRTYGIDCSPLLTDLKKKTILYKYILNNIKIFKF